MFQHRCQLLNFCDCDLILKYLHTATCAECSEDVGVSTGDIEGCEADEGVS